MKAQARRAKKGKRVGFWIRPLKKERILTSVADPGC